MRRRLTGRAALDTVEMTVSDDDLEILVENAEGHDRISLFFESQELSGD